MLLDQKYQPKNLLDIKFNDTSQILKKLSLESMPHLILYGKPGVGKRTLAYAFINHLFKKDVKVHQRNIEIETTSQQKINISYYESDEYIEICPSDYDYKDKDIVQIMIKKIAETKPILSFLSKKGPKLKLVILTQAEKLTKDAQAALRRTVETYSKNFRIILICNNINSIIEPIKSRALCLGISAASDELLFQELKKVRDEEKMKNISDEILEQIISDSHGNFRRALFFLQNELNQKNTKKNFSLEWENSIEEIVKRMAINPSAYTILEIRKKINALLIDNICPKIIIKAMFKKILSKIILEDSRELISLTIKYQNRITLGSKSIFHLEAYVLAVITHLKML